MIGRLHSRLLTALAASDSQMLAAAGSRAAELVHRLRGPVPRPVRKLCDAAQPVDPLSRIPDVPPIDLVVPVAAKDLPLLAVVLQAAVGAVRNPIRRIRLITPRHVAPALASALDCAVDRDLPVGVETDDDLMPTPVALARDALDRPAGTTWITQQLVKFLAVLGGADASLVLDADTVLLRRRTWFAAGGVQILQIAHEYHAPYVEHFRRVFGATTRSLGVSYVTHHQLMQRDIVAEMFGRDGTGLVEWLRLADYTHPSALSEYDSYGAYALARHRRRTKLARWGNEAALERSRVLKAVDPATAVRELTAARPGVCSVSFHSWMNEISDTEPASLETLRGIGPAD